MYSCFMATTPVPMNPDETPSKGATLRKRARPAAGNKTRAKSRHLHKKPAANKRHAKLKKPAARGAASVRRHAHAKQPKHTPPLAGLTRVWSAKCPLKMWRKLNRITLTEAASMCDVSVASIVQWEAGNRIPAAANMKVIAKMMGDRSVAKHWSAWQKRKPHV